MNSRDHLPGRAHRIAGAEGVGLHVRDWGTPGARPILFLHGWSSCYLAFRAQFDSDLRDNFHLVAMDLRGHGWSDKPRDAASYQTSAVWADDIAAVIAGLELARPVVVAWSYAGIILCDYVARHGAGALAAVNLIGATVIAGTPPVEVGPRFLAAIRVALHDDPAIMIEGLREVQDVLTHEPSSPRDRERALAGMAQAAPAARAHMLARAVDHTAVLSDLRCPCLISHGEQDAVILPGMAKHILAPPTPRPSFALCRVRPLPASRKLRTPELRTRRPSNQINIFGAFFIKEPLACLLLENEMTLTGRTALVTGSTSGIGLGIAHALAAQGAHIMLNGFGDPAEIESMRAGLAGAHDVRVAHHAADVADPAQIRALVAATTAQFGAVDILVNNAGVQFTAPIDQFPEGEWDRIIAINLSSVFHAMKATIPTMRERGWGRIINIASAHGLVGSADKVAYVAAKHAVLGATRVAAIELAPFGITCNAICPGWVLTPLVERQLEARAAREGVSLAEAKRRLLAEKQPMEAFTTPEQIGGLVVFLCSEAAGTMTGGPVLMDGGWLAR